MTLIWLISILLSVVIFISVLSCCLLIMELLDQRKRNKELQSTKHAISLKYAELQQKMDDDMKEVAHHVNRLFYICNGIRDRITAKKRPRWTKEQLDDLEDIGRALNSIVPRGNMIFRPNISQKQEFSLLFRPLNTPDNPHAGDVMCFKDENELL